MVPLESRVSRGKGEKKKKKRHYHHTPMSVKEGKKKRGREGGKRLKRYRTVPRENWHLFSRTAKQRGEKKEGRKEGESNPFCHWVFPHAEHEARRDRFIQKKKERGMSADDLEKEERRRRRKSHQLLTKFARKKRKGEKGKSPSLFSIPTLKTGKEKKKKRKEGGRGGNIIQRPDLFRRPCP